MYYSCLDSRPSFVQLIAPLQKEVKIKATILINNTSNDLSHKVKKASKQIIAPSTRVEQRARGGQKKLCAYNLLLLFFL